MLSVILVNYNERQRLNHVLQLLSSEFVDTDHEVIVVDNASSDGSAEMVKKTWPNVVLLEPEKNLMYGKGNNLGMQKAKGDWFLIMNVDVDWQPGQLMKFVSVAREKKNPFAPAQGKSLGLAAPQLRYPDGRIQISAHRAFPTMWTVFVDYCLPLQQLLMKFGAHPYQESVTAHEHNHHVAHVTGACLLVPRSTFHQLGGFDDRFTMYLEETEWQKRMADAGLDRWFIADAQLTHYGSAAKTFAQVSPHYLWGLEVYTKLYWRGPWRRLRLLKVLWLATIISDVFLLVLWLPSWFLGRAGRRLRHYGKQYFHLTKNLIDMPKQAPQ